MKKEIKIENYKENIINGIYVGIVLLFSSLLVIRFSDSLQLWESTMKFMVIGILGYLIVGIIVVFIHRRERKRVIKNHFHNAGGLYGFMLIAVFFDISMSLLPRMIATILWVNLLVLFLLWLGEFYYLKKMANKLNKINGWMEETLLIELPEKSKDVDASFAFLELYCKKNHMKLEILEKNIPGLVSMDDIVYTFSISMDYTIVGTCSYAIVLTTTPKAAIRSS